MTDKMKCPFCGEELLKDGDILYCNNYKGCKAYTLGIYGTPEMWRNLTNGKKALDTLKEIENLLQRHFVREQKDGFTVHWGVVAEIIKEKIASITKGDKE